MLKQVSPYLYYSANSVTYLLHRFLFAKWYQILQSLFIMAHIVLLIVADSHSSYRLACLVMQIILFALFLLSCISLGLHRTIRSKGLMFELTIYIVCIVDVRLIRPGIEYSPFSALLLFRLVSLSTEFITFQLYKTAYNFLILALEMIITFFLLKVTAFSSKLMIVLIFSHIAFHVFKEVNLRHHLKGIFILLPFGQFQESVVSTIRILDGNNWSDLYYSSIRDKGPWSFVFYFLLIVLGRYIIFSIMLAVFLDRMKSVKSGHTSVSQQSKLHKVEVAVLREIQKKRNTEILPIESQRSNELFENDTSIINKASNEKGIIEKTLAALNQGPPKRFLTNRGTLSPNILRESNEPEETERKGFFNEDLKESILEKGSVEEFEGKVPQLKRGNQRKESLNRVYPIKKQNPQVANLSMIREVVNFNTQENIETKEKESRSKLHYCTECSLFLLHQDSRLRKKLKEWTTSNFFDNSVIGLIIFGAIILAVDSPMLDPNSLLKKIIYYIDLVLNIFFSVECILKILSDGFIYNSRKDKAYIRDSWNIMDFVVVILSWLNYFIEGADGSLKSLKALRALRGLRPLRVVRKSKTLKLIVETILTSVLKMVYYLVFLAFVITPVAIISMNFYSKMHSSCQNRTSSLNVTYGPCRSDDPMSVQTNLDLFSSYPQSILTSFIVMSGEGFDSFFHELNINQQTQNLSYWFIFITFLNYFLGNVFVESTFACLTILHYVELQTVMEGTASLNQKQRNIFDLQKIFIRKTLVSYVPPIKNKFMLLLKKISESYLYDIGHLLLFAANVSFLFFDDTDQITFAINTWKLMQIFILTLYHLDIFFKFFSVGFFMYFNDGFNNIDFFSVILCDVLLIVRSQYSFNVPFVAPIFLRFFSLGRFLRRLIRTEFKIAKNFKNIMDALQISVLNLMPLFGILFIFISIFAIIGMYLFYRVPFQVEINYIYNFQNFISSFITLFRYATF